MTSQPSQCPCDSGKAFDECCGRYINAQASAPTAEALMRSRYTAYVIDDEHYLTKTWHASTRPEKLSLRDSQPHKWLGLKILRTEHGVLPDTEGVVEFVARYKVKGKAGRLHETSHFVYENGQWFYI